jgi:hypothetical protein
MAGDNANYLRNWIRKTQPKARAARITFVKFRYFFWTKADHELE